MAIGSRGIPEQEGQTVEFKASLAERREAIQTTVAFANADGGCVYFGIRDDGTVAGVKVGANTLERLADAIRDSTYPTLPVYIEQVQHNGKVVVIVEVPRDTPPVVGVYLYSQRPLALGAPVEAEKLRAYRRVGRTNQRDDFMRLRQTLLSDPRLRLSFGSANTFSDDPEKISFSGTIWVEEDSGSAHRISFHCDPPVCASQESRDDLPFPYERYAESPSGRPSAGFRKVREMVTQARFHYSCDGLMKNLPTKITLSAVYMDDSGLTWRSSRRAVIKIEKTSDGLEALQLVDEGDFSRRITRFPPKERGSP